MVRNLCFYKFNVKVQKKFQQNKIKKIPKKNLLIIKRKEEKMEKNSGTQEYYIWSMKKINCGVRKKIKLGSVLIYIGYPKITIIFFFKSFKSKNSLHSYG